MLFLLTASIFPGPSWVLWFGQELRSTHLTDNFQSYCLKKKKGVFYYSSLQLLGFENELVLNLSLWQNIFTFLILHPIWGTISWQCLRKNSIA